MLVAVLLVTIPCFMAVNMPHLPEPPAPKTIHLTNTVSDLRVESRISWNTWHWNLDPRVFLLGKKGEKPFLVDLEHCRSRIITASEHTLKNS